MATAVKQLAQDTFSVAEVLNPIMLGKGYVLLYRWFPGFFKLPYLFSRLSFVRKIGVINYNREKRASYQKELADKKPIACFSTYFMSTHTLAELQAQHHFKIINIVANPRTIHPIEICDQAINCVFDDQTAQDARALVPQADVRVTGWLVRDEFEAKFEKSAIRKDLGLDPDITTFTIVTGSEGNQKAIAILPQLFQLDKPLQIIVMCGNNSLLYKEIELLAKMKNKLVTVKPVGFQKNIAPYLQAADLVVGKAGPNSVFEAVATQTPFFALSHIAGQEDGNLEIIREYKLGYVQENTRKATRQLIEIAKNPQQLQQFEAPLKQLAQRNHQAKAIIKQMLEELL